MIRFSLLGVPVHIHLSFWVAALVWGVGLTAFEPHPLGVLFFVLAVFICLLIHELGHAVISRHATGEEVGVCLSWLGGACCSDNEPRCSRRTGMMISLAGPLAGFLPLVLIYLILLAFLPEQQSAHTLLLRMLQGQTPVEYADACPPLILLLGVYVVQISVWWNLLNLLPIFPLDGGLMVHALMGENCRAHIISMVATCLLALLFIVMGVWALAALMLALTYYNYRCVLVHIE